MRLLQILTLVVTLGALLLVVGPLVLPYRVETVLSGSMEPTIATGSVIILRPVSADDVKAGEIITFRPPGGPDRLVTHRVVVIIDDSAGRTFITQGDANPINDGWSMPATGNGWRYAFHIPYLGFLLAAMKSTAGRLVLVIVAVLELGLTALIPLWLPSKLGRPTLAS